MAEVEIKLPRVITGDGIRHSKLAVPISVRQTEIASLLVPTDGNSRLVKPTSLKSFVLVNEGL